MEFLIQNQDRNQGRKMTGLMFVALLHAALIWGVLNSLGWTKIPVIHEPIPVDIPKQEAPKPVELPPVKPLPFKPVDVAYVTPPELPPLQFDTGAIRVVTVQPPPVDLGTTRIDGDTPVPVRTSPVLKACDKPDYPSSELRRGVEGTTVLQLLIGANGKVMDSKVAGSSGSRALDRAALEGLTRCPFKAATADGKPETAWTKIQYVWRIEQE